MEEIKTEMERLIEIEKEVHVLNERLKTLKGEKQTINDTLIDRIEENKLTNSTFKFDDIKFNYVVRKQTSPITIAYLTESLKEIITDEEQALIILKYITENRKHTIRKEIKSSFV